MTCRLQVVISLYFVVNILSCQILNSMPVPALVAAQRLTHTGRHVMRTLMETIPFVRMHGMHVAETVCKLVQTWQIQA